MPYICTGTPARITLKQLNYSITPQPEFKSLQVDEPLLQAHCHLLRLPIEIRQAIYSHVFGPSLIHIEALCYEDEVLRVFRLAHLRCPQWQPGDSWDGHRHGRSEPFWTTKLDSPQVPNDQLLALCLSCRWMYVNF